MSQNSSTQCNTSFDIAHQSDLTTSAQGSAKTHESDTSAAVLSVAFCSCNTNMLQAQALILVSLLDEL